jgi:hypothetical protein
MKISLNFEYVDENGRLANGHIEAGAVDEVVSAYEHLMRGVDCVAPPPSSPDVAPLEGVACVAPPNSSPVEGRSNASLYSSLHSEHDWALYLEETLQASRVKNMELKEALRRSEAKLQPLLEVMGKYAKLFDRANQVDGGLKEFERLQGDYRREIHCACLDLWTETMESARKEAK